MTLIYSICELLMLTMLWINYFKGNENGMIVYGFLLIWSMLKGRMHDRT